MAHAVPKTLDATGSSAARADVTFEYQGPAVTLTVRFRVTDIAGNVREFDAIAPLPSTPTLTSFFQQLNMGLPSPPLVGGLARAEVVVLEGVLEKLRNVHAGAYQLLVPTVAPVFSNLQVTYV